MLRRLSRMGLRKGLFGGSRAWLVIGGTATVLRVARRITKPEPKVVYCEELPAGKAVLIKHADDEPEVVVG